MSECIIRVIQNRSYFFIENDEWTPTKAVMVLVSDLVVLGNKKVCDKMLKFISDCLNNELIKKFDENNQSLTQNEKTKHY